METNMVKKTDKTANIDPNVTVIGKESPYVTKSKPFKVKNASCKGKPFRKVVIEGDIELIEEEAFRDCRLPEFDFRQDTRKHEVNCGGRIPEVSETERRRHPERHKSRT